jgi:2-hydroxychromene-2-carboxylate isomerase
MHDAVLHFPELWANCELRVFFEPNAEFLGELERRGMQFPYVPMSRAKHLYILRDVDRLARARSLAVRWPVDRNPDWAVPSLPLLTVLRQDQKAGRRFAIELAGARFEKGLDICSSSVVEECAQIAGISSAVVDIDAVQREQGMAAIVDVCDNGIFGVPYLVIGRQTFWGLDRLPLAAAAWAARAAGRQTEPSLAKQPQEPMLVGVDGDHAGGCG